MDSNAEKIKGKAEELTGNVKKNIGDAVDNQQMEAEGAADELHGKARHEGAKASERAQGVGEQVVGGIKNAVGDLTGNRQMEAEGEAERLKGEGRERTNR